MKLEAKYFNSITPYAKQWISEDYGFKFVFNNQYYLKGNYGIVDLGTLSWSKWGADTFYTSGLTGTATTDVTSSSGVADISCSNYKTMSFPDVEVTDKSICMWNASSTISVRIRDNDLSSLSTSAFKAKMSGVYLVFPLVTPREFGELNMGNISWSKYTTVGQERFSNNTYGAIVAKPTTNAVKANIQLAGYEAAPFYNVRDHVKDKIVSLRASSGDIDIYNSQTISMTASEFESYIDGSKFIFQLDSGYHSFNVKDRPYIRMFYNQLVQNGNFAEVDENDSPLLWTGYGTTRTASDNICDATLTLISGSARLETSVNFIKNHKYFISFIAYSEFEDEQGYGAKIAAAYGSNGAGNFQLNVGEPMHCTNIFTANSDQSVLRLYIRQRNGDGLPLDSVVQFAAVQVIDLTQAGIDSITSADEIAAWFDMPNEFYDYSANNIDEGYIYIPQANDSDFVPICYQYNILLTDGYGITIHDDGFINKTNQEIAQKLSNVKITYKGV